MSTLTASFPSSAEKTSDIEFSRCCICYATYNRTNRAPISMPCGHTFCHGCIRHMTTEILFSCGVCRTVSPVGWTETKKNVALIQALEKLNLLASDDSDETLDSSPLGSNPFLVDEVNNVDSKNMLHHGNDANGTFRPIHAAIDLLKRMQMVDVDLEKDEPMDYATSELSEDDYVFDLIDADVNDIIHAVHGDDGDAVVHYVPDVVVSSLQVVNGAFHNAELFNVDDDADNSIFADLDAFGDTAEEIDEDSAKIDAFWASINAEKAYFSQHL